MLNRVQCQRKQGLWHRWKGKKREEVGQYKGRPGRGLDWEVGWEEGSHSLRGRSVIGDWRCRAELTPGGGQARGEEGSEWIRSAVSLREAKGVLICKGGWLARDLCYQNETRNGTRRWSALSKEQHSVKDGLIHAGLWRWGNGERRLVPLWCE